MQSSCKFWEALAPHHWRIENSYLDLRALRQVRDRLRPPVLVVGAGQGLILAELQRTGLLCDGVDLSPEMVRYARLRRGLTLVQADAGALPFRERAYRTIICATGVVDFMSDEAGIRAIVKEARRIADHAGMILIAFYRVGVSTERFLGRLGLLKHNVLRYREALMIYRLNPMQAIAWVAERAGVGLVRATCLLLGSMACCTLQEKRNAFHMRRICADPRDAESFIRSAPEQVAYRTEADIRKLFAELVIPIRRLEAFGSCFIVQI